MNLFLAEDDIDDSFLFQEALKELNDNVRLHVAVNGEDLLLQLDEKKQAADLIFLDLNMPVKNGFECLAELRNDERFKHVPVVVLSTTAHKESVQQAYHTGANLYVKKPSTFGDLKQIIKSCTERPWKFIPQPPPFEDFLYGS
jgi:CheY-like chemotaxis protein